MADYLTSLSNAQATISGDIRAGQLADERLRQARAQEAERKQASVLGRAISDQLAAGNLPGAAKAAYAGRDYKTGMAIDKTMQDRHNTALEGLGKIGAYITGLPEDQQAGAYQAVLPQIHSLLDNAGIQYDPNDTSFDANDRATMQAWAAQTGKPPGAEPLQEIYDKNSPTGTRFVRRSKAIGQPGKPPSGQRVNVTPEGGVTIESGRGVTGVSGGVGLNKQGANTVQKKQINAVEALDRLSQIEGSFKPQFLEIPTKIGVAWSGLKNRLGAKISPQERQQLSEFSKFKRDTLVNINRTLNELSGAAVSPQEATRIRGSMPDVGDGIFGGDSPEAFKAKLYDSIGDMKRAVARYSYLQSKAGFSGKPWEAVPLDQMDEIINQRGQELEAQVRQQYPDFTDAQIIGYVRGKLGEEFGIGVQ